MDRDAIYARVLSPAHQIDPGDIYEFLDIPERGAMVTFSGIVRKTEQGQPIAGLSYESHDQMALPELRRVLAAALDKFDVLRVACVHRTGVVPVGEAAVFVAVGSRHRGPAFAACEYIIGELKASVPIWKSVVSASERIDAGEH